MLAPVIWELTDFVYDYIFPENDFLDIEGKTEMRKFDNVTQEKEAWVRLTKLAVLSEEKYGQEHPELKNGDCVDIGDYLSCLFETLIFAGVTFPPAHVGDIIYVLQPYEAEDPVVCEIEVHGVSIIETVWHVCDKDYRFVPIRPEHCFHSKEDAEAYLEKLLRGDTVG